MQAGNQAPTNSQLEAVVALYVRGDLDAAHAAAADLARTYPAVATLHNILGVISARKGNHQGAADSYMKAIDLNPQFPDAYNNLGVALRALGRPSEAIDRFTRALKLKPDYAEAFFNLANAYRDLDRREEAVANYLEALRLAPNHLGARNNLGIVLNKLERYDEAVMHFKRVIEANPASFETYNNLGLALKNLGRNGEALACFRKAIEVKPDYATAHYNLGNFLFDLGHKEEAKSSYADALRVKPGFAEAYRSMSAVRSFSQDDPQISHMEQLLARSDASDDDRMHLHYALGKARESLGDYDKAFQHYSNGNRLRRKFLQYDPEVERRLFRQIKQAFVDAGPHRALNHPSLEHRRQAPIFIVGMPRSGTSLTEHILASHSQIFGAGELMTLGKAVQANWDGSTVDDALLEKIRRLYLTDMDRRGAREPYLTDKMHLNYRMIGFICMAMPGARIVHVKRRSIASCWSIFKHYFSDFGNGYAYDLDDVAEYYSGYMDLMNFWEERFPGAIHHFSYECLTEDQETETRNLLAYLGLEFEQSCIDFHETKRAVATISSIQVRRKLYKGSSDEWRNYEKFLAPLIERLGTE